MRQRELQAFNADRVSRLLGALAAELRGIAARAFKRSIEAGETIDRRLPARELRIYAYKPGERAAHFARKQQRNPQPRTHAGRQDQTLALRIGAEIGRDVPKDLEIDATLQLRVGHRNGLGGHRDVRLARACRDANGPGVQVQLGETHQIVRQDRLHVVRELLEDRAGLE